MPQPINKQQKYFPGLDGIRALAVLAVIAYHIGIPMISGGLLGVGIFFTLSGYLITGLLRQEYRKTGKINLPSFWMRRIRRLLPALIAVLITVIVTTAIATPQKLGEIWVKAIAGLFYVANWQTILAGQSYFDRFAPPGPLDHLWSLAIEEQFYIVWPPIFLLLMLLMRKSKIATYLLVLLLSVGSFYLLWHIAEPGFDNTRAYEGSDTRAGGLLLGALVALIWPAWREQKESLARKISLDVAALLALVGIVWLFITTDKNSLSLYSYGLLTLSIATCILVVAVTKNGTVAQKLFGLRPLTWIGERSYGLYLWHMPVVALSPNALIKANPYAAAALEVLVSFILAILSWKFIEDPIRRHGFRALILPTHTKENMKKVKRIPLLTGIFATMALAICACSVPQEAQPGGVATGTGQSKVFESQKSDEPQSTLSASEAPASEATATTPAELKTKCDTVVHIGDSTSVGMMSEDFLPDPADRVDAQYKKYGAKVALTNIYGGRSIIETPEGTQSVADAVEEYKKDPNFHPCWVIAMGTNEVANFAAGSAYDATDRIDTMMEMIGDKDLVLWPTVRTIAPADGYYDNSEMQKMNKALAEATKRYKNLWVYDWGAQNKDEWYQGDGIHFTTPGNRWRSAIFARALATAFPANGDNLKEKVFTMPKAMIDTP